MFLNSTIKCAPTSTPTYHARTGTLQNPGASDQDLLAEPATMATESNPRHGKRRSLSEEVLSVRQAPIASYGHLFRLNVYCFFTFCFAIISRRLQSPPGPTPTPAPALGHSDSALEVLSETVAQIADDSDFDLDAIASMQRNRQG